MYSKAFGILRSKLILLNFTACEKTLKLYNSHQSKLHLELSVYISASDEGYATHKFN